jgi:hypothetical protein
MPCSGTGCHRCVAGTAFISICELAAMERVFEMAKLYHGPKCTKACNGNSASCYMQDALNEVIVLRRRQVA